MLMSSWRSLDPAFSGSHRFPGSGVSSHDSDPPNGCGQDQKFLIVKKCSKQVSAHSFPKICSPRCAFLEMIFQTSFFHEWFLWTANASLHDVSRAATASEMDRLPIHNGQFGDPQENRLREKDHRITGSQEAIVILWSDHWITGSPCCKTISRKTVW